jgi:hypothetical protein
VSEAQPIRPTGSSRVLPFRDPSRARRLVKVLIGWLGEIPKGGTPGAPSVQTRPSCHACPAWVSKIRSVIHRRMPRRDSKPPGNRGVRRPEGGTEGGTIRTQPSRLSQLEQSRVVEFPLVEHDVRVDVRGRRQVPLADELPDPRPRNAAQVQERDPAVAEVVRAEQR